MLIGSQRVSHRSAPAFVEGVEIKKNLKIKKRETSAEDTGATARSEALWDLLAG